MAAKYNNPVCFAEYYLHHMERLPKISPAERRFFWEQRHWHPVVKMRWNAETKSEGCGVITYPDGTRATYSPPCQS